MSSVEAVKATGIATDPYLFTCPYTLGHDHTLRQLKELGSGASGEVHMVLILYMFAERNTDV